MNGFELIQHSFYNDKRCRSNFSVRTLYTQRQWFHQRHNTRLGRARMLKVNALHWKPILHTHATKWETLS